MKAKKNNICLIYNYAQHYRASIFTLMDKELDCDFVFGDKYLDVKKMDYSLLRHKVKEVRNLRIGPFSYQCGVMNLAWQGYGKYIMLGEPMNLSTWGMLLLSKVLRKDVYLWSHGWYGREGVAKKIIKKIFFNLASGVLLYGNYARNLMIENGFNPKRLFVVHNSLDYDKQIAIRKQLKKNQIYQEYFGNTSPVLLFVGRLTKVKRLDMLLELVHMSVNNNLPLNLILIGEGEEQEGLQRMADDLKIVSHVWFYGASYDEMELSNLIYNADICVAPGNVGLTAMHSLVYGCPVITHDNFMEQMPEFEAIREGITGDFFKQGDVKSLYNVVQNWIKNHTNREEIRNMAYKEIDLNWNPYAQLQVIRKILEL
mgnify:CR=1 FL=1